jgi:hypothetical protein
MTPVGRWACELALPRHLGPTRTPELSKRVDAAYADDARPLGLIESSSRMTAR